MLVIVCAFLGLLGASFGASGAQTSVADSLTILFDSHYAAGRFQDAAHVAQQELVLRRNQNDPEDLALCLKRLATAQWKTAEFAAGEAAIREAMQIRAEAGHDRSIEAGECLNILGLVLMRQGRNAEAEEAYRQALVIYQNAQGDIDEKVASIFNNLGAVHEERGDVAGAEHYRRATLAMLQRLYGDDHVLIGLALHNLATNLNAQGEVEAAEVLLKQALDIRRRHLPQGHPDTAFTLSKLAEVLVHQSKLAEAQPLLQESVRQQRASLGPEHPRVLISMTILARVLIRQGQPDAGLEMAREVLDGSLRVYGEDTIGAWRAYMQMGEAYRLVARYDDAKRVLTQALELTPSVGGLEWQPLYGLSTIAFHQGDWQKADQLGTAALEAYKHTRDKIAVQERRGLFHVSTSQLAAARLLSGHETRAWSALEASLGRFLAEMLIEQADRQDAVAHRDSLLEIAGALENQIDVLRQDAHSHEEQIRRLGIRLLEIESEVGRLEMQQRALYPTAHEDVFPLSRIQESLDSRTALVGWLDVTLEDQGPAAWAYLIRHQGPVIWVRLGDDSTPLRLDRDAPRLRAALAGAASWPQRVPPSPRVNRLCRAIGQERIDPLLPLLEGVQHLVVLPTGAMTGIPVEILLDRDATPLGHRFHISYCVSATVWTWLQETGRPSAPEWRGLVIGDPEAAGLALPRSREEALAVGSLLPSAVTLIGADASESRLVQLAENDELRGFDIIHFAGHAEIDVSNPRRSALLLSTSGLPDPIDAALSGERVHDGRVSANEILRDWRLDAELVTLSGCQTALGRQTTGEGYLGLAHTFFRIGARSLVVSLWKVDDEVTALLMERFYHNLVTGNGVRGATSPARETPQDPRASIAAALQEAKSWLRQHTDSRGRSLEHPAYWSGFVLLGVS